MQIGWIHTKEVIYTVILFLKLLFKASFNSCVYCFGTSVARFWNKKLPNFFKNVPVAGLEPWIVLMMID